MTSVNAFATLLEAFFKIFGRTHTHTHRRKGIALPLLCMRARGKKKQRHGTYDMMAFLSSPSPWKLKQFHWPLFQLVHKGIYVYVQG